MTDRLKLIIDHYCPNGKGGNVSAFARSIGIGFQTVKNYIAGRDPSFEFLSAILVTYPELSAEWLMRGEGEMIRKLPNRTEETKNKEDDGKMLKLDVDAENASSLDKVFEPFLQRKIDFGNGKTMSYLYFIEYMSQVESRIKRLEESSQK